MRSSLEIAFKHAGIILDEAGQKAIKAFDKVANYQHISERLSCMAASSRSRHLFMSIQFNFLNHYVCRRVYRQETYVHAEVQLAVYHRLQRTRPSPRMMGTSKAACYLCNLFPSLHPQYKISATHGMILEAWTIPDVMSYSPEDRRDLRNIIRSMQNTSEVRAGKWNRVFSPFPIQSGIYHPPSLPSLARTVIGPAASFVGENVSTGRATPRGQIATRKSSVESCAGAATISLAEIHATYPSEVISRKPYQQSSMVDERYSKSSIVDEHYCKYTEPEPPNATILPHKSDIAMDPKYTV